MRKQVEWTFLCSDHHLQNHTPISRVECKIAGEQRAGNLSAVQKETVLIDDTTDVIIGGQAAQRMRMPVRGSG